MSSHLDGRLPAETPYVPMVNTGGILVSLLTAAPPSSPQLSEDTRLTACTQHTDT